MQDIDDLIESIEDGQRVFDDEEAALIKKCLELTNLVGEKHALQEREFRGKASQAKVEAMDEEIMDFYENMFEEDYG